MTITDRDRKILWSRAQNRCSFNFDGEKCDTLLLYERDGETTVVGEECHIVGPKEGSPRYQPNFPDADATTNLILLCRTHHKVVDTQESIYTTVVLREIEGSGPAICFLGTTLHIARLDNISKGFKRLIKRGRAKKVPQG